MLSSPLQQAESDRHSETADIETALSVSCSQSDDTENFPRRRSFVDKARNFWQRYGTFCQDTVVQITYFVPEVVVAIELEYLRVDAAKACPVRDDNPIKGTAIGYKSQTSSNFAVFDNQFFLKACAPKWSKGNLLCWRIFVAAIFFHQLTFFSINVLKVSEHCALMCQPLVITGRLHS
jgi:hypothetical protein